MAADEVYRQGYTVLEGVYSTQDCQDLRELLDAHWHAAGRPSLAGRSFGIHPLLARVPGLAPYLARPEVVDALAGILRDEVRLARAGGRISDESSGPLLVHWHNHYHWPQDTLRARAAVERVLALVYPDGTGDDVGNVVVLPRPEFHAPIAPLTPEERAGELPGERVLRVPPGSVVVIDSALWHTARRGDRPGRRHIFGGQYQGWSVDRPHPDDHEVDVPEIAAAKRAHPGLAGLVARTAVRQGGR